MRVKGSAKVNIYLRKKKSCKVVFPKPVPLLLGYWNGVAWEKIKLTGWRRGSLG